MTIRLLAAGAAVAAAGALTVVPVTAANASTGCATHSGYDKVHKGQSLATADRHLGSSGHLQTKAESSGYRDEVRSYRTCSEFSIVTVAYSANPGHGLTVSAKDAVWVS